MNHHAFDKGHVCSTVQITRFTRGEARKIFDEVNECGIMIVMDNNSPDCVLIKPELFNEMVEMLEDYALFIEAEDRMKNSLVENVISYNQVLSDLGICESDVDDFDVAIE
jgi:PHD/YefM family antitoxin component YafN of YafNO toxin-antitoxin module